MVSAHYVNEMALYELKAKQASTASPTLRTCQIWHSFLDIQFGSTNRPSFIRTTSSITSLSRSGNMPDNVLGRRDVSTCKT